jgi:hypothetical protein
MKPESEEYKTAETKKSSLMTKLEEYLNNSYSQADRYKQMTTEAGLPEQQKKLADLNVQIAQLTSAFDSKIVDEQGKPILSAIIGGRTSLIQRQKAVEVGGLSAVAQAMQGNISSAQGVIKDTIEMEFGDELNKIESLKLQLEMNQDVMTAEEKKVADQQNILLDERERVLNEQATERESVLNLATMVAQNGAPTEISSAIAKAKTVEEALQIGGDYLAQMPGYESGIIGEYQFYTDQVRASGGTPMGFNEYQNLDANRKIAVAKAGIAGYDSQTMNFALKIADKFDSNVITKNFAKMSEAINLVNSLSDTTTNPADDQALIYAFAKAMDPDSVVREGEYATVQKYAQSWIKSYGKGVEQAIAGTGFLSEEARKNIKKTIASKYNAGKINYDNLRNESASQMDNLAPGLSNMFLKDYNVDGVQELTDVEARNIIADKYPSLDKNTQAMITEMTQANIPFVDIVRELGFNQGGSGTPTATLSKVLTYKDGQKAGQCGRFVNQLTGLGLGDSFTNKMSKMNPAIKTPKPGMVFVMPYKDTGHTGFIIDVKNGMATVRDSNYSLDEKVKTHQIPVSKMTGFTYA